MLKIINWIIKIIMIPFEVMSLPFKILDWILKIFAIFIIAMIVYFFDWIPVYTNLINYIFPELGNFVASIKLITNLSQKIPLDKLQKASEFLNR